MHKLDNIITYIDFIVCYVNSEYAMKLNIDSVSARMKALTIWQLETKHGKLQKL